jgi:hypothetical protein
MKPPGALEAALLDGETVVQRELAAALGRWAGMCRRLTSKASMVWRYVVFERRLPEASIDSWGRGRRSGARVLPEGTDCADVEEAAAGVKRQRNVFEQIGIDPEEAPARPRGGARGDRFRARGRSL